MIITIADKLNMAAGAFSLFSGLILLWCVLVWYRKRRVPLLNKAAILIVLAGMASIVDAYWIEPNWLKTERVVIHDAALAEVLEGISVVQISDIHLQGGIGELERDLTAQVNALKPDLLFITGDFFSDKQKSDRSSDVKAICDLIRSFRVKAGIFGVLGNYDGPLTSDPANMEEFKAAGIDMLINENRAVALPNGKILYLAGFYDYWSKRTKSKAFGGIPSGAPVVLLAHDPHNFGEAIGAGVNLVLAGHTHGGQIGVPFLIAKSRTANKSSFMRGLFDAGKTKMYVNRGIGTTHIPVRFFDRPEITILEVRK